MSAVVFITGTDTDVGKTVASLLAMRLLATHGTIYLKPVQTGSADPDTDSDPAFIHRHLPDGLPLGMRPADCIHDCRTKPKAPLFTKPPVNPNALCAFVAHYAARHPFVVVEGAGGILTPIAPNWTMLDFAGALNAHILVIARAGLGTINHSLLTLRAIVSHGLPCLGTILMDQADTVPAVDRAENAQAISAFSGLPVHGIIGRIADPAHPEQQALDVMYRGLRNVLHSYDQ